MGDTDPEKILKTLQTIFSTEKILELQKIPEKTVNELYSFKVENKKYIIKILTRPPISEMDNYRLEKEANLMKRFTSINKTTSGSSKGSQNVPVPEIIHIENNTKDIGYRFIVMNFVEGEALEEIWKKITIKEKTQIITEFAKTVRNLHNLKFDMFGDIEEYSCPRRFYSLTSMLKANSRRYAKMLGTSRLLPIKLVTQAQNFVEKNLDKTKFVTEPFLVHSDLHPKNVLVKKQDSWKIKAILDFEWSYAADPIFDLFDIEKDWMLDSDLIRVFLENYSLDKKLDLDNYRLEEKIFKTISLLATITVGWVFFHPTEENITRVKDNISKILANDI
ncbi:MAG: aminoglycoside phosphotransferase family protein [Asgard group archaeon]|nr:aminoglycoside phosphotransferase family protein [Asgard group archaeon]